jgi:8-oxo-dGTP pyrophosphatase MutT (NUDIX family)
VAKPFPPTIERIERALRGPLPGEAAKRAFWPKPLRSAQPSELAASRQAAVLIALHAERGEFSLLLLRRSSVEGDVHSGQLALPGGRLEVGETIESAALRETEEELGIARRHVRLIGRLSDHWIPVSSHLVSPVVGWIDELPPLLPDPKEVDAVVQQPIAPLLSPKLRGSFERDLAGARHSVPCWKLPAGELWGATAMILAEFLAVWDAALRD